MLDYKRQNKHHRVDSDLISYAASLVEQLPEFGCYVRTFTERLPDEDGGDACFFEFIDMLSGFDSAFGD